MVLAEVMLIFVFRSKERLINGIELPKAIHKKRYLIKSIPFLVPSAGVEPAHPKILVFETNASTNSASWASCFVFDDANI